VEDDFKDYVEQNIMPILSSPDLLSILNQVPVANIRNVQPGLGSSYVRDIIQVYVDEAIQTLNLINDYYDQNSSLLEIGGGIGLVNIWLQISDRNIISIEPSAGGHDNYYKIGHHLIEQLDLDAGKWLSLKAEEIGSLGEKFDLIFSNNVLEHIEDIGSAFKQMKGCLNNKGVMRHACPNYFIPYEPHYGIFLIPGLEKYMSYVLPKLLDSPVWESLNFIKAKDVIEICMRNEMSVKFDQYITYKTIERLYHEKLFAGRHRLLTFIFRIIKKTPLFNLIKLLPPRFSTPMFFSIRFE